MRITADYDRDGRADAFEHDELFRAGIDPEAMGYLTRRERRRILKDAGLDPDEYDF